jgi:hypothetical protein
MFVIYMAPVFASTDELERLTDVETMIAVTKSAGGAKLSQKNNTHKRPGAEPFDYLRKWARFVKLTHFHYLARNFASLFKWVGFTSVDASEAGRWRFPNTP